MFPKVLDWFLRKLSPELPNLLLVIYQHSLLIHLPIGRELELFLLYELGQGMYWQGAYRVMDKV